VQIRIDTNCDGTPCEGKLSCTVWDGGKGGDNIKVLPIVIVRYVIFPIDVGNFSCSHLGSVESVYWGKYERVGV